MDSFQEKKNVSTIPISIQLLKLPIEFWNVKITTWIAKFIGTLIVIDSITMNKS